MRTTRIAAFSCTIFLRQRIVVVLFGLLHRQRIYNFPLSWIGINQGLLKMKGRKRKWRLFEVLFDKIQLLWS